MKKRDNFKMKRVTQRSSDVCSMIHESRKERKMNRLRRRNVRSSYRKISKVVGWISIRSYWKGWPPKLGGGFSGHGITT